MTSSTAPSRPTRTAAALAGLGIATVATLAIAGPAAASPAPRHAALPTHARPAPAVNAAALRQVDGQLRSLSFASWVIGADRAAASDKAALSGSLSSTSTALKALHGELASDTTGTAVAGHLATLSTYHVNDFVLPRVGLVLQSDDLTALGSQLEAQHGRFATATANATTAGKDTTAATAALTSMQGHIDALNSAAVKAHDETLALQVADYPGNSAALGTARTDERAGATAALAALRDARTLRGLLRTA
jgi:hypothetical protein